MPDTQSPVRSSSGAHRSPTKWSKDFYATWSDLDAQQARMDSFLPSAWLHVRSSFIRQSRNLKPSAQKLQALAARLRELLAATEDADIKVHLQQQLARNPLTTG